MSRNERVSLLGRTRSISGNINTSDLPSSSSTGPSALRRTSTTVSSSDLPVSSPTSPTVPSSPSSSSSSSTFSSSSSSSSSSLPISSPRGSQGASVSGGGPKVEVFEWGSGFKVLERPRLLRGKNVKSVRCGAKHMAAILEQNELWMWGEGKDGQLGLGQERRVVEYPVAHERFVGTEVLDVWCGPAQTAVVAKGNKVWMWGSLTSRTVWEPELAPDLSRCIVKAIVFGPSSLVALIAARGEEGQGQWKRVGVGSEVVVKGESSRGLLGLGPRCLASPEMTSLPDLKDKFVVDLAASESHVVAVTKTGQVYTWGSVEGSGSGTGIEGTVWSPTRVKGLESFHIVQVQAGLNSYLALSQEGPVLSWGEGGHGELGHGDREMIEFPMVVRALSTKSVVGISRGPLHSVAWTNDGGVYSWGHGQGYRLGHDSQEDVLSPGLVQALADGKIVVSVSCSSSSSIALVERNIISVRFRDSTLSLPVNSHPFVGQVLKKIQAFHNLKSQDILICDHNNRELGLGESIRDLKANGVKVLQVVMVPTLWDEECETLLFDKKDPSASTPVVKAATVEKLVEWLTFPRNTGHDFTSTFLLTYRTWMTSEQLLQALFARFRNPLVRVHLPGYDISSIEIRTEDQLRQFAQLRVLNTIKRWLTDHIENFLGQDPSGIIQGMSDFLEEILDPVRNPSQNFAREASNVQKLVQQKLKGEVGPSAVIYNFPEDSVPEPSPPLHDSKMDIFKYSPQEIARQLAIIDYFHYFKLIMPGELIGQAWNRKGEREKVAPNVLNMIHRFNVVSEWVAAYILSGQTRSSRTKRLERFIDIADESFKINNFNGVMMVVSAFNGSAIYRLKSLWDKSMGGISQKHIDKYNAIKEVLDVSKNMSSYRDHFVNQPPPKIPFLGTYLQDLTFIDDGNKDMYDEEKKMVNFNKRMLLADIISIVRRLQQEPYRFRPIEECNSFLLNIKGFDDHEKTTFNISKFIEQPSGVLVNDDISDCPDFLLQSSHSPSP